MDVLVGVRVVRGPDWTWGEQDGGEGHVGTVAEVLKAGDRVPGEVGGRGPCVVTVQWDCGNRCRYRCGVGDRYDLRVLDSAPAGIKHHRVVCSACSLQLTGIRWRCVRCGDCDLCTFCYMSGKHELDHDFERMDTARTRVRVPTRVSSKKKEARGIYQHAEVMPGHDWIAQSVDGGTLDEFMYGEVVNILGSDGDNSRGFAEVKWSESEHTSIHKVGSEGKVELKCVEPSCVSYYYPDHLPELGAPVDDDAVVQSHDISPGDYVKVELDPEIFKAMHEGSEKAGWVDLMLEMLGETGRVQKVFENGDLKIKFPLRQIWTVCAEAVTKMFGDLPRFSIGDTVSVKSEDKELQQLLTKNQEAAEYFSMFYGERCRVVDLNVNGLVTIAAKQKLWFFPPLFLSRQDDLSTLPWTNPLPNADDLKALRDYLQHNQDQVDRKAGGRTALHCAAVTGNKDLLQLLLEFGAGTELQDHATYRPLHCAVLIGSTVCAELLIKAGADVNSKGFNGNTPLILAANGGHAGIAKLLLRHLDIKVNDQDLDGNTALHIAVLSQQIQVVSVLMESGADPSLINFRIVTPIIEATRIGFTGAVKQMILHNPESAKVTNDYLYNILHVAAQYDHRDIVTVAIEMGGIDVNCRDDMGNTPLHIAIQCGNTVIIEQLVEYGADVNAQNASDITPLYATIMYRDGFDAPSSACPKLMKLHEALMGKLAENVSRFYFPMSLIAFLLKNGADMHIETRGQSPIRTLPYLAELMTILAENEQVLSGSSPSPYKGGVLVRYGSRPYITDSTGSKSTSETSTYTESHSNSQVSSSRPYGSYFSSMSRKEDGERGGGGGGGRGGYGYDRSSYQRADPYQSSYQLQPATSTTPQTHDLGSYQGMSKPTSRAGSSSGGYFSQILRGQSHSEAFSEPAAVSTCFLCDSPANVRFQPCGHSVMCSQCAARAKKCPTCRGAVKSCTRL